MADAPPPSEKKLMVYVPTKFVGGLWAEFRAFAFKGNLIDLAVAVIIGAAFGKVVDSLVKDVMMPLILWAVPSGDEGYKSWAILDGKVKIGAFLAELVNFLFVALAVFIMVIKVLKMLMREKAKPVVAPAPPPLTRDQELLTEIRDLLRRNERDGQ